MNCPRCGGSQLKVKDSRDVAGILIRRRRRCLADGCEFRFNTIEIPTFDWALLSLIGFAMGDKGARHVPRRWLAGMEAAEDSLNGRSKTQKSLDLPEGRA
jgi:hypothetical protein